MAIQATKPQEDAKKHQLPERPYAGEALLLRLSAQLEAAAPWSHRRPPAFAD